MPGYLDTVISIQEARGFKAGLEFSLVKAAVACVSQKKEVFSYYCCSVLFSVLTLGHKGA